MKILHFLARVRPLDQSQLLKSRQSAFFASFVHNFAALQGEDGGAGEIHLLSRARAGELSNGQIREGDTRVGSAANPSADNIRSAGNQRVLVWAEGNVRKCLRRKNV